MADSLPPNATVIDVGAGYSRLGHEIAAHRPDIEWFNVDLCYSDAHIRTRAELGSPDNVQFLSADIVAGSARLADLYGSADLVCSYWLLPHLSLKNDEPAKAGVATMYDLLAPSGKLIVGPIKTRGLGFLSFIRYRCARTYDAQQIKQTVIDDAVAQTKLWWLARTVQRLANQSGVHLGAYFVGGKLKLRR